MSFRSIKVTIVLMTAVLAGTVMVSVGGCKTSQKVAAKSGVQLWAENCQRCHNTPSPASFSKEQWVTVGMHMQSRALLTNEERDKIVAFLQQ